MRHPARKIMLLILTLFFGVICGVNPVNAQPATDLCSDVDWPVNTDPAHGDTDIPVDAVIQMFDFSCTSSIDKAFAISPKSDASETDWKCLEDKKSNWEMTPDSGLLPGTLYRVDVEHDDYTAGNGFDCYFEFTTAAGGSGGGPPPPPPPTPPSNVKLRVKVSPGGQGQVTGNVFGHAISGDPIDCPDDCSGSYPPGTSLRLTAEPAAGQKLERWKTSSGVHVTKRDNPVDIRIDADGELTAEFRPNNGNSPPTCEVKNENGAITGGCEDPERDEIIQVKLLIYPEQNPCKEGNPDYFSIIRNSSGTISFQLSRLATGKRFCAVICSTDKGSGDEKCTQETCFNTGNNGNVNTPPLPAGLSQKDYKLVSFPVNLANSRATDFLGLPAEDSPGRVRFLTWDTAAGRYITYKNLRIVPGRGYWYLSSVPFDGKGSGVSTSGARSNDVSLLPGWNLIATPTAGKFQWNEILVLAYDNECRLTSANIRIGDLAANNPFLEKNLLSWNGSGYSNAKTVEAYKGY